MDMLGWAGLCLHAGSEHFFFSRFSVQDRLDWPKLLGALYDFSANQSRSAVGDLVEIMMKS